MHRGTGATRVRELLARGRRQGERQAVHAQAGWLGDEFANSFADSAAKDAETVKGYLQAFEGAGCDELTLCPSSSDLEQVDLLAEAAGI